MENFKVNYQTPLAYYDLAQVLKDYIEDSIVVCIGTDKCIGDSLAPFIGTMLKEQNYPLPVYGTLDKPIHALNLKTKLSKIKTLHSTSRIIAIDACLGKDEHIGDIYIKFGPLKPGKGVGKSLPPVGDISIIGLVDSSNDTDLFSSRSIRLNFIFKLARIISHSLLTSYTLNKF